MKSIVVAVVLLLVSAAVFADQPIIMKLKPHAPGCMTPELLDQLLKALKDDDKKTGESLLDAGCVVLPDDVVQAELLTVHTDKLEIKVTRNGGSLVMWIPMQYDAD